MKVLHLIQKAQLRGAEVFASQLSTQLVLAGHEAVIVHLFDGSAKLPFEGKVIALGADQKKRFLDVSGWRKLAAVIRNEKPDIIQANAGDTLKYAVFSKLLFRWRQPIVFRNASMISLYIKSPFARIYNSFFFLFASRIISVSNASKADFANIFPRFKTKLVTIPIGIQPDESFSRKGSGQQHKNVTEPPAGPVLLHVGGFSFEKNHTGLLSIFAGIKKTVPNAMLHLVGDGPLRKQVEKLAADIGMTASVVFHGFKDNPLHFIGTADVLLLPSIIEGLPGVILEGFFCNTPVVAYDVGGISEIVINGSTGRLVALHDEQAFAASVIEALHDNESNRVLVRQAHRLVMEGYLTENIAIRFVKEYLSVLASLNSQQLNTQKFYLPDGHESK